MEMRYDGALLMPSSCTVMNEDEMAYVEGGRATTIPTLFAYMSRTKSTEKAKELKGKGFCVNMTVGQVAREIHAHAVYGFVGGTALAVLGQMKLNNTIYNAGLYLTNHGLDGISLGDNPDSTHRVLAYNAVWGVGLL